MKKRLLVWSLLNIVVLVAALRLYDGGPNRDIDIILYVVMGILSFPTSVLAVLVTAALLAGLHAVTGSFVGVGPGEIVFIWCVFFVAGILQWFVVIPRLVAYVKHRRRITGKT